MEIFWSNDDQQYRTIPDGDIATHKQIKDYFEKELKRNGNCRRNSRV